MRWSVMVMLAAFCVQGWALLPPAERSSAAPPAGVTADPKSRGALLYEQQCTSCHDSVAHRRARLKATSAGELQTWVQRWAQQLGLGWSEAEIDDVVRHLDQRFYRFEHRPEESR